MEINNIKIKYLININDSFNKLEKKVNLFKKILIGGANYVADPIPYNHVTLNLSNKYSNDNISNLAYLAINWKNHVTTQIIEKNNKTTETIIDNINKLHIQKNELLETIKNRNDHITSLNNEITEIHKIYDNLLISYNQSINSYNTLNIIEDSNSALDTINKIDDVIN